MRNVLITGGSSGIGLAVASRFLGEGDQVMITGRNASALEKARRQLGSSPRLLIDVGALEDYRTTRRLDERIRNEMGRIDVLVNNAGIAFGAPFLESTRQNWEQHFAVNLIATVILSQACAQIMIEKRSGGIIINTSSIDGVVPEDGLAAYSASKAALNSLTKSMAIELAEHSIRVFGVSPGWIRTPIYEKAGDEPSEIERYFQQVLERVPMGRVAEPDEIAGVYIFLASDDSRYMTGQTIVADGGRLAN